MAEASRWEDSTYKSQNPKDRDHKQLLPADSKPATAYTKNSQQWHKTKGNSNVNTYSCTAISITM